MESETTGADVTQYAWDLRNRMIGVDAPGTANDAAYAYDHDSVRVQRTVNGVATSYLNDGQIRPATARPSRNATAPARSRAATSWGTT
jgi:hypothetical protein